ncbi:MAG TPA: flagellar hook-basal body complex protein FliE [Fimbriimonadaceae bacterium]|nr:flagellar hook-basal body complex protein FliE [Fimbriimonadaceae bacterium]
MTPISGITNPAVSDLASKTGAGKAAGGDDGFGKQLMDVLKEVNEAQTKATSLQTDVMTGRHDVDYHDLMIAMEKASVAMQLTMAVRNKVLDAYQQISTMQI